MFGRRARKQGQFEGVVAAYSRRLLSAAMRLTADWDAAQDVVQDAFIRLSAQWRGAFEPSPQMEAWLSVTVRNLAIDHIRRERRLAELHRRESLERAPAAPPAPGQGGAGEVPDEAVRAAEALATLDEREREVVVLRVYEEKSYQEISEMTGLTVGNVGFILHAAMKKLARALGAGGGKEARP